MQISLARIFVQNSFCAQCVDTVKTKILEVQHVSNVIMYPSDSLVVFNFNKANQLSEVLNTLSILGYPPLEDTVENHHSETPLCTCIR
jgi:hypothetical protein